MGARPVVANSNGRVVKAAIAVLAGAVFASLGHTAAVASTDGFQIPVPSSSPSDDRAEFHEGNATTCSDIAGVPEDAVQIGAQGSESAGDNYVSGTTDGTTMLDVEVTPEGDEAGVVVDAVVVKGGNGYNVYRDPFVPPQTPAPQNYIAPTNEGGNIPDISHWFVCYHIDADDDGDREAMLRKTVIPPPGTSPAGLPTEFVVVIRCSGENYEEEFEVTFGPGGGVAAAGHEDLDAIPDGTVCTVEEQGVDDFPAGSKVTYDPPDVTDEGVVVTDGESIVVDIVNDFSHVTTETGQIEVVKVVEAAGGVDSVPDKFVVGVGCTDGTRELVTVPGNGGSGSPVVEVAAGTYSSPPESRSAS